jgi:hypothetical protein
MSKTADCHFKDESGNWIWAYSESLHKEILASKDARIKELEARLEKDNYLLAKSSDDNIEETLYQEKNAPELLEALKKLKTAYISHSEKPSTRLVLEIDSVINKATL